MSLEIFSSGIYKYLPNLLKENDLIHIQVRYRYSLCNVIVPEHGNEEVDGGTAGDDGGNCDHH